MTAAGAMDERIADALKSLKSEGHIDDQFEQLLLLQDDSDPDFVKSVMQLFFEDSQKTLQNIHDMLERPEVDYGAVDQVVHQLKGSSASFGARGITSLCMQLRHAVQGEQREAARTLVRQLVQVRQVLLEKLTAFCQLEDAVRQGQPGAGA